MKRLYLIFVFAVSLTAARAGSLYGEPAILSLPPDGTIVQNYQELKNALENDNGLNIIYFGADITMQSPGVKINAKKTDVIISGKNPLDPAQTEPYTLTDYSSASFYSTVYIDTIGVKRLTVRDLKIQGKNYYGPFSIIDIAGMEQVTLTYEGVDYNGPQFVYHRRGKTHIKDCTVNIHGANGGSVNQEFSEAKHLIFEGKNQINTQTSTYSIFWHPLGGSFTLADDAALTVTSPNTSGVYGVFYADGALYNIDILIGKRAAFNMDISGITAPELNVTIKSFIIEEAGSFYLKTTKSASADVLAIDGELKADKEASFIISGYGGSAALLKIESGDITIGTDAVFQITSEGDYKTLIGLNGCALKCDDPALILLAGGGRCITADKNPGRIFINARQINYWDTKVQSGFSYPALYKWEKQKNMLFSLEGDLAVGTSGNFTSLTSNYVQGEPPGSPPDTDSFNMVKARILAFGRLELMLIAPHEGMTEINGITKPGASVRVSFLQNGEIYTLSDVTADAQGIFTVQTGLALETDTIIKAHGVWNYLSAQTEVKVEGNGRLEFFVPEHMEFFITEIPVVKTNIKRLVPGWEIVISDNRVQGSWSLYARLTNELTPDKGLPALKDAVIFIAPDGEERVLSTVTDTLILENDASVVSTAWQEDKGILLKVLPGLIYTGAVYKTEILWTLIDAP